VLLLRKVARYPSRTLCARTIQRTPFWGFTRPTVLVPLAAADAASPDASSRCVRAPLQHHTKPDLVCRFQPDNERNRTSTHCVGTNHRNMS
jgi:hypothetical protein